MFDFDQDIWAVSTDGVELRRIVDPNPSSPSGPRAPESMYGFTADVSPDGSRIVYSSCEFTIEERPSRYIVYWSDYPFVDTGYEIGVIDVDGTGQVRLTKNGDFDSLPVWSPDGTEIAFVGHSSMFFTAHDSELYTMYADGSRVQRVFRKLFSGVSYYPPAWSPDGEHLAFAIGDAKSFDGNVEDEGIEKLPSGIYVMRADGTDLRQIADGLIGAPAWSPDGSEILFVSDGVYVAGPDGSGLRELGPGARTVAPHLAVWSPDGSRIAVLGDTGLDDGQLVLLTMDRDGTDQHILVREEGRRAPSRMETTSTFVGARPQGVLCGVCGAGA